MHTAATPPSFTPPSAASARSDARERELLACVALQDKQAFEELYVLYHRPLARFLMRLALRYELAEEVINDTFWVVWRQAERFRGDSRVSTWIMGIAYRRALKSLRRELTRHEREIGGDEQMIDLAMVEEPVRSHELQDWILAGLKQLPLEQRTAIELAYYFGHSFEEIASIMGCPPSTVKARMFHARARLRTTLRQQAGPETP
jgi:RNA polymerase sigma-70 factor (ECF subfamily)